jgi:predicted TIM-barrel fold metal-dependent hydrolase
MSGYAGFPGHVVREKVGHPIVDADAHIVECPFVLDDYLRDVGGPRMAEAFRKRPPAGFQTKWIWWGAPSGEHTADRAMAMLPKYFASRMDECGIDFAHMLTTYGISGLYIKDDELRVAFCRATNKMYADMFRDVRDKVRPVAIVPTYSPAEAIRELEYAVLELGHKAVMIGTELRLPWQEVEREAPQLAGFAPHWQSIAYDAPHDYDPFWQRCVELGIAPICHTGGRGIGYRASPTNYMFNHIGDFATGSEFFCRSLFFGGVTKRFPTLNFAFLEGGVAWAMTLLNDIVEHWEKRNLESLERDLDPAKLDVALLAQLFDTFGDAHLTGARIAAEPHGGISAPGRPPLFDEFAQSGMTEVSDLKRLFCDNFYFGCEADDRTLSVAFNRRLNPAGGTLKPMFGSDIGHWDVMDAASILSEAYSLVEGELITPADFRELTLSNPMSLHLRNNPAYFAGTAVETAANEWCKRNAAAPAPARI